MAKNENRCWPGYEPVKGKSQHEQGSCRKKAPSKSTKNEKEFQGKRERQLAQWKKEHPGSPRKSAQHLGKPGTAAKTKRAAKKTAAKKASASTKKAAAKKTTAKKAAAKKTAAKKTTAKKATAKKSRAKRA